MKNKSYSFLILFLFVFLNILLIPKLKAQGTLINYEDEGFISGFDVELMAKKYLADYSLVRKRAKWNYGREYVYKNNDAKIYVFLTIGLHSSERNAENIANEYLKGISIKMENGVHQGVLIGNKFWWWAADEETENLTNVLFIRKNALIIMSCSINCRSLKRFAEEIDNGIINGESYVQIDNAISYPTITSVEIKNDNSKINIKKITINAVDPSGETLEYQFSPGLMKYKSDPVNVYTLDASGNNIQESFETNIVKVVVINERNVISPISEIELKR